MARTVAAGREEASQADVLLPDRQQRVRVNQEPVRQQRVAGQVAEQEAEGQAVRQAAPNQPRRIVRAGEGVRLFSS